MMRHGLATLRRSKIRSSSRWILNDILWSSQWLGNRLVEAHDKKDKNNYREIKLCIVTQLL